MRPTLTIFIDGLPFDLLSEMAFSSKMLSRARLIPSLGYSVNCQSELFTGKSADDLGFWCEWSYEPDTSRYRPLRHFLSAASITESFYPLKRVVHKFLDKFSDVSYTKNIPLRYLSTFDETGFSVFDPRFCQPSLLDDPDLKKFLYHQFAPGPERDMQIAQAALDFIEQEEKPASILLTLVGIDHCSHWEGVGSEPYMRELEENDRAIRRLTEAFLAKQPDGVVLVVSDHGMTNIEKTISIDLEGKFGRPGTSSYAYFSEATLLRVWLHDESLREPIRSYLNGLEGLEFLTDGERREFKLTNPRFGDLIYHTPVGIQIVPSYWGNKPSVGMHGHHPKYPSQHGVCLASEAGLFDGSVHASDFYEVMRSLSSS